jgi:hypothetical protein
VITDVVTEGQTLRQRVAAALRFAFKFKFSAVMTATFLALLVARRAFHRQICFRPVDYT